MGNFGKTGFIPTSLSCFEGKEATGLLLFTFLLVAVLLRSKSLYFKPVLLVLILGRVSLQTTFAGITLKSVQEVRQQERRQHGWAASESDFLRDVTKTRRSVRRKCFWCSIFLTLFCYVYNNATTIKFNLALPSVLFCSFFLLELCVHYWCSFSLSLFVLPWSPLHK